MAFTNPWQQGDPSQYKQSDLWNTPWAQQALNNKSMANYANQMGQQSANYLSGNNPLGRMADTYGQQSANYMNGNNRIANTANTMGGYASKLFGSLMDAPGGWGSSGGSWSGYGSPNDPRIAGHMANLRGGTQNLLDDYVKRTANAGVASSRGGMGVAGGTPLDAQLRQQQMGTLAKGYGDNYSKAMDWTFQADSLNNSRNSSLASALSSILGTQMQGELGAGRLGADLAGLQSNTALGAGRLGVDLAGLQYKGLEGQNAWDLPLLMQRAQDYRTDANNQMNWAQNEWRRQMEYKNSKQAMDDAQLARDQAAYMDQIRKNFSYPRSPRDINPNWMGDFNYYAASQKLPTTQGKGTVMDPSLGTNIAEYNTGLGALKPSRNLWG